MKKTRGSVVPLLFISLAILSTPGCSIFRGSPVRVNIRVIANSTPAGSRIYLAGEGNAFGNWKADGVPLVRQPDGTWAGTVMPPPGKLSNSKSREDIGGRKQSTSGVRREAPCRRFA
ncbi:MAG TPA: CBM20 domain-containing protein [Candidatus Kryptobacter bacterium]|nr:CBM20 domain-containing protein [Candidatus Kryptobacter bacterium]